MAKKTFKLDVAAHNNDTVVLLGIDWPAGQKIEGCLGFAITRIAKGGRSICTTLIR